MCKQRLSFEVCVRNYAAAFLNDRDKMMSNFRAKWMIFRAAGKRDKRRNIFLALIKDETGSYTTGLRSDDFLRYEVEHIARDATVSVGMVAILVSVVSAFLAALSVLSVQTLPVVLVWIVGGIIVVTAVIMAYAVLMTTYNAGFRFFGNLVWRLLEMEQKDDKDLDKGLGWSRGDGQRYSEAKLDVRLSYSHGWGR